MAKIIGNALPNIPWQDPPETLRTPLWRFDGNPIIGRDGNKRSNSVFNSAVVPYKDGFAGVFRCDSLSISMDIFAGFSKDGIHWTIDDEPIHIVGDDPEITKREYRYDARVCLMEGKYYVSWCNGYHGPTIGLAWTEDFKTFHQLENAFLPYNRNGVLFPRKIQGRYMMMSRPSDTGDTSAWQSLKIGPGPSPIETDEGWLLIYHGVINTCNGYVYRMGAALLDLDEPWKVKARGKDYILAPQMLYECVGDVPNVTFPCAALTDAPTGRIAVYYGCADTVTGLAFTTVDRVLDYIKANSF